MAFDGEGWGYDCALQGSRIVGASEGPMHAPDVGIRLDTHRALSNIRQRLDFAVIYCKALSCKALTTSRSRPPQRAFGVDDASLARTPAPTLHLETSAARQ